MVVRVMVISNNEDQWHRSRHWRNKYSLIDCLPQTNTTTATNNAPQIYILYIIQQVIKQRIAYLANGVVPMHIYASPAPSAPTIPTQTLLDHPHTHRVMHNVVRQHRVVVEDAQRLQTHLRLRPVHQPTQPREQRRHVRLAHRLRQQLALQQQLQQQLQQRDRLRRTRPAVPPSWSCWRATC